MRAPTNILRTKLYPPKVVNDHVHRVRLVEKLNNNYQQNALTLVSAPAGYGKSYLVSCWLTESKIPYGWISLSEDDNDLRTFLEYLLAAVEKVSPGKLEKTYGLLQAAELPPLSVIINNLLYELDEIEKEFVLVLDDYHLIKEKKIHDLIDGLLQYPPDNMLLCMVTQRDPPLKIGSFRAYNRMSEIRMEDLSFTVQEIPILYKNMIGLGINEEISEKLLKRTEGWITGLRLTAHSVKTIEQLESILKKIKGDIRFVTEYLVEEVLAWQPEEFQKYLMKTSLLDRFCSDVVEVLDISGGEEKKKNVGGEEFIEWLEKTNLFVISLDDEHKWFRYHHEFQKLLQKQLKQKRSSEQIKKIHKRASEWFEKNDLIDEAIKHSLAAGDSINAGEIVERHRLAEMNQDRWYVIKRWLDMLPEETKQQRITLLLAEVFSLFEQFRLLDMIPMLEQIETKLLEDDVEPALKGELFFYRSYILIYLKGDAKGALKNLHKAKALIPESNKMIRAEIELYLAMAKQMTGDGESAVKLLKEDISTFDKFENIMQSRLLGGLVFVHLLCGDLESASIASKKMIHFSEQNKLLYAITFSHYTLANVTLNSFHLEKSLKEFSLAFEKMEIVNAKISVDIAAGLILNYLLLGRLDEAVNALKKLQEYVRIINEPTLIDVAESCNARLLLLQGKSEEAIEWARSFTTEHHVPSMNFWLEVPSITQARVLITAGSNEDLNIALQFLTSLTPQIQKLHNSYQYIEILVLKSLALEKLGREDEAITVLEEVVLLAKPKGWIRPFIEAGNDLIIILEKLIEKDIQTDYCKMLIEKYESYKEGLSNSVPSLKAGDKSLDESLTERELEILSLLSRGLKNREIGDKIFLAQTTIKKHIYNIYQKLDVHSRIEVVNRAKELNIIS